MENNINPANQSSNIPENNSQPISLPKSNPIILILLILFILIIATGAFVLGKYSSPLQPQPEVTQIIKIPPTTTLSLDPSAAWKTYNHPLFIIKIPPSWDLIDLKNSNEYGDHLFFASPNLKYIPAREFPALRLRLKQNTVPLTFEEYKNYANSDKGFNISDLNHKEIKIDGNPAYQTTTTAKSIAPNPFISTSIYRNNNLIVISLDLTDDMTITDFDQILSTFKFLE